MHFYEQSPDAECVIHEAELIDENGDEISGIFAEWTKENLIENSKQQIIKLNRNDYLEKSVLKPLAHGMVLCISKSLVESAVPFPKCNGFHDQWIIFSSILNDSCWYTSEVLEKYRLHGENECGNNSLKKGVEKKLHVLENRLILKKFPMFIII